MANQYGRQFGLSKEPVVWNLFARITFGNTGAPTLVAAQSKGVRSISRTSAGLYVLTLTDSYVSLLDFLAMYDEAANGPGTFPAAPFVFLKSYSVTTQGAGTVTFQCSNLSGVATDPASTEAVFLKVVLKNSSAY